MILYQNQRRFKNRHRNSTNKWYIRLHEKNYMEIESKNVTNLIKYRNIETYSSDRYNNCKLFQ